VSTFHLPPPPPPPLTIELPSILIGPGFTRHLLDIVLITRICSFVSEIQRITARDYIPSNDDILRAPMRNDVGITETYIHMGQLSLRLCHISHQHSERKKWIHLFEGVTSIIFCVPLSDYDLVDGCQVCACRGFTLTCMTTNLQNRMAKALVLFESVINSRWFLRTSVILFLTRIDEFKAKLSRVYCGFRRSSPLSGFLIVSSDPSG
jgi:guanine nucleotide-binding protein G(i) subunit alpha